MNNTRSTADLDREILTLFKQLTPAEKGQAVSYAVDLIQARQEGGNQE